MKVIKKLSSVELNNSTWTDIFGSLENSSGCGFINKSTKTIYLYYSETQTAPVVSLVDAQAGDCIAEVPANSMYESEITGGYIYGLAVDTITIYPYRTY